MKEKFKTVKDMINHQQYLLQLSKKGLQPMQVQKLNIHQMIKNGFHKPKIPKVNHGSTIENIRHSFLQKKKLLQTSINLNRQQQNQNIKKTRLPTIYRKQAQKCKIKVKKAILQRKKCTDDTQLKRQQVQALSRAIRNKLPYYQNI